jgi:protein-disulfide isomerase
MSLVVPVSPADHAVGDPKAPVTLVEYGDYECPYCGAAYPILQDMLKELGDSLRFVFRNMPLGEVHPNAVMAAQAAEAAAEQGKFWPMHDALYEHQESLGPKLYIRIAGELGLDVPQFEKSLHSARLRERVHKDFMGGVRSGVAGTPTFFINGSLFEGRWDDGSLARAIGRVGGRRKAR